VDTFYSVSETGSRNDHAIVLKGRFKAVETNTYGLFIIFLNEELRTVENLMAIASHYSSLYDIDPHLPWYTLEEDIINLKWKGDIAVNISIDLQNYLESSLDRDRGNELYTLIKNNDQTKIESLLQAIIMKPLSDRNILLETLTEVISKESMRIIRSERNKPKRKQSGRASSLKTKTDNYIAVDLILAPVSGIPIYDLTKGDRIMVRINDTTTRGRYYVDLLGASVDGNIVPVPAEVTEITRGNDNEYNILCKIGEEAIGKAVETEHVKIKKYDTLFKTESSLKEFFLHDVIEKKGRFPLFVVITGSLMFIVLLVIVIMWFYNIL